VGRAWTSLDLRIFSSHTGANAYVCRYRAVSREVQMKKAQAVRHCLASIEISLKAHGDLGLVS
jgi:hypothetical protein